MEKKVYLEINNREQFFEILKANPGVCIIKFTATWCKPCQKIKNQVNKLFMTTNSSTICFDLDVDDMFDLYAYFKKQKLVKGIPAMFAYKKGNLSINPDYSVSGSDIESINTFFKNIYK